MLERLRAALGPDAVRDGRDTSFRLRGAPPVAVIAPADAGQAAEALRFCSAERVTVRLAGAGTWLHAGPPHPADVVLTAERLTGILEYEPADLVVAAAAGTPLASLDAELRPNLQFFPVRPPADTRATIGGMIATASAGPLRLGCGTPRDHVLGLQVITGDGRVLDFGGRVVKNVAGYDLVRPLVGSGGTLGFITRAFLRLRPLPDRDVSAVFAAPSAAPLVAAAAGLAMGWPVAVELFDPATARDLLSGHRGWLLAARWHGNTAFAEFITRAVSAHALRPEILDDARAATLWSALEPLEATAAAAFRLTGLPDRLPDLIETAGRLIDPSARTSILRSDNGFVDPIGLRWRLAAHARSGIVRVWTEAVGDLGPDLLIDRYIAVRQGFEGTATVRPLVLPLSARSVPVDGPPAVDGSEGAWAGSPVPSAAGPEPGASVDPVVRLNRGLRKAFDPAGVFAATPGPGSMEAG
jgi:glycolate oxidase FAD binding subunit